MVAVLGASVAIVVLLTPPAEYLPEGEEPKTFAAMSAPPGYSLGEMRGIAEQVQAHLLPALDADPADFEPGAGSVPPIKLMVMLVSPTRLLVISETVEPDHIEALMNELTRYYEQFPGMRAFAAKGSIISSNDGGTRSISLDIAGSDLANIYAVARRAYARAETIFDQPRIQTRPSTLELAQPLVEIRPDWDRAAELDLGLEAIGFTVSALTEGAYVDDFFLDDDKIDIYLYGAEGREPRLERLDEILIKSPEGASLPLTTVADIETKVDTSIVRRVDGKRMVTLDIIPPESVALETGVQRVREELVGEMRAAGEVPAGVTMSLFGASDQLDATREALAGNFVIALAIVYLLLVAIFTHWRYPLLIMTAIPLGIAGGIAGLALMNLVGELLPLVGLNAIRQPFDMITMLGFLILMGTVVNNPILLVEQARRSFVARGEAVSAVMDAVAVRLRPIVMTTLTTLSGLSPLVLIPGEGTELYRGVGVIVMFGLLGATVVTLTFLPALTATVLSLAHRRPPAGQ